MSPLRISTSSALRVLTTIVRRKVIFMQTIMTHQSEKKY
nr:MAG TPA: hypothetical protein [Caudoviricetes sp.]